MLCFVVVMQSFIKNLHEVFIHIHHCCFAGTGAIVRLPQCQWSKPDGYGKISQRITTTKHSKAKTVCIFIGIYGMPWKRIGLVRVCLGCMLEICDPAAINHKMAWETKHLFNYIMKLWNKLMCQSNENRYFQLRHLWYSIYTFWFAFP